MQTKIISYILNNIFIIEWYYLENSYNIGRSDQCYVWVNSLKSNPIKDLKICDQTERMDGPNP